MKYPFTYLLLLIAINYAKAQVLINEVAPTNTGYFLDEDDEASDWIELYNTSPDSVAIAGWALADNTGKSSKWMLPNISIPANNRVMVFASGKNRGAYTPPPVVSTNHWETALYDTDNWRYFVGTSAPPANWTTLAFNASSWTNAQGGFGYGDADDNTSVLDGTIAVYYRKTFTVNNPTDLIEAILSMDYDDGFVAYLNGTEIARSSNISGTPNNTTLATTDHEAAMYSGGNPESFALDAATLAPLLLSDTNVLALEIHNVEASSSDLSGRTWLHFGVGSTATYFGNNPAWFVAPNGSGSSSSGLHTNFKLSPYTESLYLYNADGIMVDNVLLDTEPDHVRARIPDGGNWCYSDVPTPNAANSGVCYAGYATAPVFSLNAGFYSSAQSTTITGLDVRYTGDGNNPTATSTAYTGTVSIPTTRSIRARCFEIGKLPSETITRTYFINQNTTLPIVSITAAPGDLFNGYGGPAWYDNAPYGGGAPKVACHVAYFDAAKNLQFNEDASFAVVGNFSTEFDQKPMQFQFDEEWGAKGDVPNKIFTADKPGITALKGFRVRNMDDDYTDARMRDIIANRMSKGTYSAWAGYQNVAVFINGEYWGHYGAREILDENFCHNNFGANVDSIDLLKTRIGNPLQVEVGSDADFLDLYNFVVNNDMSNTANYNAVKQRLDVLNYVDYFANQIFNANQDWFTSQWYNNTEFFTSRDPIVTWKYIQWDQAYGMYSCGFDLLSEAIDDDNNSTHSQIFSALLDNSDFRNYFINRFADLINTKFKTNAVHQLIDANAAEIAAEIPLQYNRWNGYQPQTPNFSNWQGSINSLKDFYTCRPNSQRDHIQNNFGLAGQSTITVQVSPVNAGYIKISTVIPTNYPWTGTYFKDVPVTITAIPKPGYTFSNWNSNTFIADVDTTTFTNNITANTTFTANFTGSSIDNPIVVSEVNYNSDSTRTSGDWIELHNTGNILVDISDYVLQDEHFYNRYLVPTGTTLPANGYLVIAEDLAKFANIYPAITNVIGNLEFDFDNSGDSLTLTTNTAELVSTFRYNDANPWAQCADGHGRTLERISTATDLNLPASWFDGCMMGSPGMAYTPCNDPIIFNEINYKSPTLTDAADWIELYNTTTLPINIGGWKFTDDGNTAEYTLPIGTTIAAGAYLVIYSDLTKFVNVHPDVSNIVGAFTFGLNSGGEVIRLYDQTGKIKLTMFYNDAALTIEPDGNGPTLELTNPNNDINLGNSWNAGCAYGTPGMPNGNPLSNISISGNNVACFNNVQTYSVPAITGCTYTWTVTGGNITAGQGTAQITVQWDNGVAGNVNVVGTVP